MMLKLFLSLVLLSQIIASDPIYAQALKEGHEPLGGRTDSGGNLIGQTLEHTRELLRRTLETFKKDKLRKILVDKYCYQRWSYEEKKGRNYNNIDKDTQKKRNNLCSQFTEETSDQVLHLISAKPMVELKAIIPKDPEEFLFVDPRDGTRRVADAKTKQVRTEPILYNYPRIRDFDFRKLMILTYHELGHKVKFRGKYLGDYEPMKGLGSAGDLLNAVAYTMYMYARTSQVFKEWKDENIIMKKDYFNCKITNADNKVIAEFVTAQARQYFKNNKHAYKTGIGIGDAFGYEVTEFTKKLYPQERIYFSLQVHEEDGCKFHQEAIDKRSVRMQLVSRVKNERDLGKIEFYDPDAFCNKLHTTFTISHHDLMITCIYEGYHNFNKYELKP